ncbi:MAG: HAMP domain-containing histidine kinase [Lachnospiraceae bacterium]|nr:HAMP domain-containing histidine kinase [Lachnospiraceae bacterium]
MKIKTMTFKKKLWLYFTLFTAFIFTMLWLFQTVFLQGFYNGMLIKNTRNVAEEIVENGSDEQINDIIDRLARDNSVLVFVTDKNGNLLYGSDEYKEIQNNLDKGKQDKPGIKKENDDHDFLKDKDDLANDRPNQKKRGNRTELPDNFDDIYDLLLSGSSDSAELDMEGLFAYGTYINYPGSEDGAILYVSTTKDAVGSSVRIIRIQLIWVTVISLVLGFILSWLLARKFSNPVDNLSKKAKHLGTKEYEEGINCSFCLELDELNETLDETNIKLNRSREFQMELLSNVSHDLRTPLTMIKGYAEMIRDISWENDEDRNSDVQVIIKEADRLTALVNEILEYSELQSMTGEESSEFEEIELSELVRSSVERFEKLSRPENITIEKDISGNIKIKGDVSRLERALYNLMDNAVRHTGSEKNIRVSLSEENGKALVKVTDFGNGISEEESKVIWDRYYTSRQRKGKGVSGLGLAIVKQIVTMHSGSCYVESTEGEGSTFVMAFPK